jgi:hypothetical protein
MFFCHAQHIDHSYGVCFYGSHGIDLVMDRGGGARQVVDLVDHHLIQIKGADNVLVEKFEIGIFGQVGNILLDPVKDCPREQLFSSVNQ